MARSRKRRIEFDRIATFLFRINAERNNTFRNARFEEQVKDVKVRRQCKMLSAMNFNVKIISIIKDKRFDSH